MPIDLTRVKKAVAVERLLESQVAVVGAGGSAGLVKNLCRSGVKRFVIVDPDRIEPVNMARQDHRHDQIGEAKVEALAVVLRAINPDVEVRGLVRDFTSLSDEEVENHLGDCDLLVLATDFFPAQAKGNEIALGLKIPAVWIGLYTGGLGGEIAFWHPRINACFRCLMAGRYKAQRKAKSEGVSLDPASDGTTVFDVEFVDSIAGQLALGLLTQGADNRFGRLITELGDRNFILAKIDPGYKTLGRDLVREKLGVGAQNDAFFSWNAVALRDPTGHEDACPDCRRFRGDQPKRGGRRLVGDGTERIWPAFLEDAGNSASPAGPVPAATK